MKTILRNQRSGPATAGFLKNVGLILIGLAVAGCPSGQQTAQAPATAPAGKVTIRGSNTVGEELAPRLIAEYKKDHPAADFDLLTKGTSYGMGALMGGFCDIAGASRLPLKEELEVAQFRNVELNDHVIGTYSVAVVVNAANPVGNLTREQVRDIFTGAIQNWKDVGGPDAPIHLFLRDPISGTYIGFKELTMENKPYASEQNLFTNYEAIVGAVAKDANGIGYSGFNLTHQPGVKAVSIGGVEPTAEAVNQGKYPYARTLHLYTNKANERPAVLDFIQFIQSPRGQEVMMQMGYVPHS
ncbi:MAG: phosphate ABC transporter substrate-binding protein [Limisphaerales bacterium]